MEEIKEAFSMFDTKGDGKMPCKLVGELLRALDQNPTETEVARLLQDQDMDGRITFETFLPILHAVQQKPIKDTAEDFVEGFQNFDSDGNGFMSGGELRFLLTGKGEKMSDEDVEDLIGGYEDNDGNINYEQFIRMVMAKAT